MSLFESTPLATLIIEDAGITSVVPGVFGPLGTSERSKKSTHTHTHTHTHISICCLHVSMSLLHLSLLSHVVCFFLLALTSLSLSSCQITVLEPFTFAELVALEALDLSSNPILQALLNSQLTMLLQDNELAEIESGLFASLVSLQTINLNNNNISRLGAAFGSAPSSIPLTSFSATFNNISFVDQSLFIPVSDSLLFHGICVLMYHSFCCRQVTFNRFYSNQTELAQWTLSQALRPFLT